MILVGPFDQRLHCIEERTDVVVDNVLNDGVVGIEVAVSEVVAHTGDLLPRHVRWAVQEAGVDALNRFADLDERARTAS